ncbi:hypothetical protein [uncultured Tenacibaculum sp.]|uniref:hypothetical protein n=1 Tax=uncultured Tenacibaculum sp. TaxID=174713 RepID=UPI0026389964|nr:hypothetical protein [uncultured Tenacibaculum sp.]
MIAQFKKFKLDNLLHIYGGLHVDSQGVPADNSGRSVFDFSPMDHGDNGGIPPDNQKK